MATQQAKTRASVKTQGKRVRESHALYKVRRSKVHGYGAFATRAIKKGLVVKAPKRTWKKPEKA